jgi:DNA-binding protein YbaB
MFGKMMEMKQKMEEMKQRLDQISVSGNTPGNDVVVRMNGNKKLIGITVSTALAERGDADEIAELMQLAFERAMEQAESVNESEMRAAAGNLLPGLGGML